MNLLNALGVPLSDDLMAPTGANEKGYFESWAISKIHDAILGAFGLTWATPTAIRALPPEWWRSYAIAPARQALIELVGREFDKAGSLWGFKDPRTARLLPLWKSIVEELDLEVKYVLVSRHPRDCARSLQKRDGMSVVQGELLWLEHTADAFEFTAGKIDAIVEYDRWFDDGYAQAEYLIDKLQLEHPGTGALKELVETTVSGDLRHSRTTESVYALPFTAEFNDAVAKRDLERLGALTNLFAATRVVCRNVAELCTQELAARLNETARIANERAQRIGALEARLSVAEESR